MKYLIRGLAPEKGFVLSEMAVGIGLVGLTLSLMVSAMLQAWKLVDTQQEEMLATTQLRHALRYFASDALNAQSTDLTDGALPVSNVTLSWTDASQVDHTVHYSLVGTNLVRTFDDMSHAVAREVVSVAFTRSGATLFVALGVTGREAETKSLTLRTGMRAAEASQP